MTAHSLIVLRPRFRPPASGFRRTLREVAAEFVTFERTHARVASGVTFAGFVLGLALRALGWARLFAARSSWVARIGAVS
jgi:hypothetical protein